MLETYIEKKPMMMISTSITTTTEQRDGNLNSQSCLYDDLPKMINMKT